MSARHGLATAILAGILSVGCDPADRRADIPRAGWTSQRIEAGSEADVFEAARFAVSQWFRINEARPSEGMITTYPNETEERGGTGRIRDDAIGYRNRIRRLATVRVRKTGAGVATECVVVRERLDTSDMRVFETNRQFNDVPNQTQISGEGATSARQNEVWTEVGRDRALERDILRAIRDRLAQPQRSAAPTAG
ncbi:MAG: hypothetical protein L6Q92_09070 [Phycisphaerae bacterium]|nr:hypothetical protein [Phycisphaerae bacterium]